MLKSHCIFCLKPAEDGIILTDGSVYHLACYDHYENTANFLSAEIKKLENEINYYNSEISKANTLVYKIRKLIFGVSIDISVLKSKISENQKSIDYKKKQGISFLKN